MGGYAINCSCKGGVGTQGHSGVKKGYGTIFLGVLNGKLDMGVLRVDVLEELMTVFCLLDYKGVMHKPDPQVGKRGLNVWSLLETPP